MADCYRTFMDSGSRGVRPQLQRRDRAGITPASLHSFRIWFWKNVGGMPHLCQENDLRICEPKIGGPLNKPLPTDFPDHADECHRAI